MHQRSALITGMGLLAFAVTSCPVHSQENSFKSQYYIIHHDLDDMTAREAALRLDKVFEEYRRRTTAFTGKITQRLPAYLFSNKEDYFAAGGPPGSAGVFMGDKLMGVFGDRPTDYAWKTLQHEGFHQFVHAVIRGRIPPWVNEGMAEYFDEAVFTGDTMLSGVIPQRRLKRIRKAMTNGTFRPLEEMMLVNRWEWNENILTVNYDQSWSMVHFLAHGENGKYQKYFDAFLQDVGIRGLDWKQTWTKHFGPGVAEFETAWRHYWLNLPDHPTFMIYAEATTRILTGCLGRATSQKQTFDSARDFFRTAADGKLLTHSADWMPPSLVDNALEDAKKLGRWKIITPNRKNPELRCSLRIGKTLRGSFTIQGSRIGTIQVSSR